MVETEVGNKITSTFPEHGIVVDKSLTNLNEQFRTLPAFVVDFLIAEMVDPKNPSSGLERIGKLLDNHFMSSDKKEWVKGQIREKGEYTLIGRVLCRFDEARDEYWADVAVLGNQHVRIDKSLIDEYGDILLTSGAWGTFSIAYDDSFSMRNKLYPFPAQPFLAQ